MIPIVNTPGLNSIGGGGNNIIAERLGNGIKYEIQYRGILLPAGSPLIKEWKFFFYNNGKVEIPDS